MTDYIAQASRGTRVLAMTRFLHLVHENQTIEMRALHSRKYGVMHFITSDFDKMARAAEKCSTDYGADVYHSLSATTLPTTKLTNVGATTKDKDVPAMQTLLIDLDPVRQAGMAATDEQREAASMSAFRVSHALSYGVMPDCENNAGQRIAWEIGARPLDESTPLWPHPVVVSSGNGYQLLYRTNSTVTADQWRNALHAIANRFNAPAVNIDLTVTNPARIARMPYTLNRKAGRYSYVQSWPGQWLPVRGELIRGLAAEAPQLPNPPKPYAPQTFADLPTIRPRSSSTSSFEAEDVLRVIKEFDLDLVRTMLEGDTVHFYFGECPLADREHESAKLPRLSFSPKTGLGFHCFADACAGQGWQALKHHLHERTGRWPTFMRYDDDLFDDVEDVRPELTVDCAA